MKSPEDAEEDFLGQIQRFVVVTEQVERQLVHHPLVLVHELGAGIFVAGGTTLDQRSLSPADVCPGDGSKRLHKKTLSHLTPAANHAPAGSFNPLEPRDGGKVP